MISSLHGGSRSVSGLLQSQSGTTLISSPFAPATEQLRISIGKKAHAARGRIEVPDPLTASSSPRFIAGFFLVHSAGESMSVSRLLRPESSFSRSIRCTIGNSHRAQRKYCAAKIIISPNPAMTINSTPGSTTATMPMNPIVRVTATISAMAMVGG